MIVFSGKARWVKLSPSDCIHRIDIGSSTSFTVWVIGQPLPRQDQWHWNFSPGNFSHLSKWDLRGVSLRVHGNIGVLSIDRVTEHHYGDYLIWAENDYGGWPEGDLRCRLVPKGKSHLFRFDSFSDQLTNPVYALICLRNRFSRFADFEISCYVNNNCSAFLVISLDQPDLTVPGGGSAEVTEHSNFTLTCAVNNGVSVISMSWYNMSDPSTPALGCSGRNATHCSLNLYNIDIFDSGTYQCRADSGALEPPKSISVQITVYG